MSTPTILLLDDDANTLLVLHAILEKTQAKVIECEDESCTLNWCQRLQSSIDLLVADVILKVTNGPAVVRQVKPLQPLMRLLFISGFSLSELRKRGLLSDEDLAPGRVEFLQKPFTAETFLSSVQQLLPA
ncbi:MAG TPA: response regulator [Bryobacteraceae bacterium]|nr:response regulator [Bryobacteraceae bacterium]